MSHTSADADTAHPPPSAPSIDFYDNAAETFDKTGCTALYHYQPDYKVNILFDPIVSVSFLWVDAKLLDGAR